MSCFSEEQLEKISNLVKEIEKLSDIEKLMLYLQLPCGRAENTEGKYNRLNGKQQRPDIFSKKPDQETTQTYTWILSHLEEDPNVSLPKQEVYDEYRSFCQANRFEPLCVADFGKAMKHAFPCIKPRRLGQRGNSRYCYSGLRKKYKIQPPSLPDIGELLSHEQVNSSDYSNEINNNNNGCTQQQQQHNYKNINNNDFSQSPSTSASRLNAIKSGPTVAQTNECSPLNNNNNIHQTNNHNHHQHHHHQQHVDQQHQQPQQQQQQQQQLDHRQYSAAFEAMNLKVDHTNHEQHNHRVQPSSVLTHHSGPNGDSYVCDQLQHHLATTNGHKMGNLDDGIRTMTNQMSSSSTSEGSSQAASIIDGPQQMTPTCDDYGIQQQQQQQQAGGGPSLMHHRHDYDYHGAMIQRFGTPDDDDYRHNYQDLNRPIVSEVIPFSQTGQYQPSARGFIYGHSVATQQQTHPLPPTQQQEQQQTLQSNNQANAHQSAKQQHPMGPQQQARPNLRLDLSQQINSAGQCGAADASSMNPIQQQQQQPQPQHHLTSNNTTNNVVSQTDCNQAAPTSEPAAHANHQYQQQTTGDGEHDINHQAAPHSLQLNINNNHLNNQSVDCCASPWASPASTPYPGMANLMMHDVQEYYPGECLRYDH